LAQGFELIREADIPELSTIGRLYRHRSGAQLLSLINDDENKVFGATFRTPVSDSTGVAHILEHAVLCGSRKYPLKEPFVELIKGSLNTFLNAFTYPDKTCYPVASANLQDFYNLVDVYLDAVFYPRLTPQVLGQEGWHYALDDISRPLQYRGVVYNEMKGAQSDPEGMLFDYVQQSLFPDSAYRHEAGGHPRQIPELTFAQFERFHAEHYHPANALLWFSGDDDPQQRLALLAEYLDAFEPREMDSRIRPQRQLGRPRRVEHAYAAAPDGDAHAMISVNWLLPVEVDQDTRRALQLLEHVLLGTPGSPLRRALIESGLGDDLTGPGLEGELQQLFFGIGLSGVDPGNVDAVERLVLETLAAVDSDGIQDGMRAAALNTMEFGLRENNTGSVPRGLGLMLRALRAWLYDRDPFQTLAFEASLERVKQRLAHDGRYLETLLRRYILDNPHRTTVVLLPDPTLEEREQRAEQECLARARDAMTEEQLAAVAAADAALQRAQAAPDSPEDLARLPSLSLSDLPRGTSTVPTEVAQVLEIPCLHHDLTTHGIVYLDVGFDMRALRQELLPLATVFGRVLLEMGTAREDYGALGQRIGARTGGLDVRGLVCGVRESPRAAAWLFLRGKAMADQVGELCDIIRDVLLTGKLDERERFLQIVLEEKAQEEMSLVPDGSRVVSLRLGAQFDEAGRISEQMRGLSYLYFLRQLVEQIEQDWDGVCACLREIRTCLVNRRNMLVNVTVQGAGRALVEQRLAALLAELPAADRQQPQWNLVAPAGEEALVAPSQVNYVGKAANLFDLGYAYSGATAVVIRYLGATWLWDQVRVQGGAYGAFCAMDPQNGVLRFGSYRDPRLLETLEVYDRSGQYLRDLNLSPQALTRAIIGTIGDLDLYQLPDAKGYTALARHLSRVTDDYRQQVRDGVFSTRAADFADLADLFDQAAQCGRVVVLGSQDAIGAATQSRPDWLEVTRVM
jgi:presequence protease